MLSLIWKGKLVKPLESYDPESIGEYKLIGRLGSGGFGTVYVATKNNGLKFALKVLHQSLSQDLKVLERLSREAEAIGKVEGKEPDSSRSRNFGRTHLPSHGISS